MEKDNALRLILENLAGIGKSGERRMSTTQAEAEIKALSKPMGEEELGEYIRKNCSKYLIEEAYAYRIASILSNKISGEENKTTDISFNPMAFPVEPQPQNNIEELIFKDGRIVDNLGNIIVKINEIVDRLNQSK
jgi:hypothetical protein